MEDNFSRTEFEPCIYFGKTQFKELKEKKKDANVSEV